jgi:transcription initiation factor TFIID subunit TAF12
MTTKKRRQAQTQEQQQRQLQKQRQNAGILRFAQDGGIIFPSKS